MSPSDPKTQNELKVTSRLILAQSDPLTQNRPIVTKDPISAQNDAQTQKSAQMGLGFIFQFGMGSGI